ncbi:MAG TPA: hypothetical protein VK459_24940, partial [Polyangiaceae bacterium]|nr:hypothetical protein [Polyangiaceae bacterium]
MRIAELQPLLELVTSVDVGVAFEAFKRQSGSDDLDEFLMFLRDRGYLSAEAFQELHGLGTTVEVTSVSLTMESAKATLYKSSLLGVEADGAVAALKNGSAHDAGDAAALRGSADAEAVQVLKDPRAAKYAVLGFVAEGGMGQIHVAKD